MSSNINEILESNFETMEELFNELIDYSLHKGSEKGYKGLNTIEQKLFIVGTFLNEVSNGGLEQYFTLTNGQYAKETIKFLNSIEEANFLEILTDAYSIYRSDMDEEEQYEALEELDIDFFNLDREYNKLYEKCIKYVKENV